jgi:hypothetical protein
VKLRGRIADFGVSEEMPGNEYPDEDDTEEADRRNGEPGATHARQTGDEQAEENRQNDPPA